MSKLSVAQKTRLESALNMTGGYVLDFSNTAFEQFFRDLGIEIYDEEYAEYGNSKANRLRALWQRGSHAEIASTLESLAEYIEAKKAVGSIGADISDDQIETIRVISTEIRDNQAADAATTPVAITTEATVTDNRISIVIHEDIYSHIKPYLATGDYFHAVEESYKLVREKLRELTGKEKASDVFNNSAQNEAHYEALFGKAKAVDEAEADFYRGVGYLHLSIQHLRNEKAHTPATPLEPNLAIHYISLASLAYDLITQYVSDASIQEIEELILDRRRSYRSATIFYRDLEDGKWMDGLRLPSNLTSAHVRRTLKGKWLNDADFTRSFDDSNVVLMRLELVADQLSEADLSQLLDLPTKDKYGNDQQAGLVEFLEYLARTWPGPLPPKARDRMTELRRD